MTNPTLKRTSVTLSYRSSDGYSITRTFSSIGRMGLHPPAELPLMEAIEELARVTALFGFEDKALEAFTAARERVRQSKALMAKGTGS